MRDPRGTANGAAIPWPRSSADRSLAYPDADLTPDAFGLDRHSPVHELAHVIHPRGRARDRSLAARSRRRRWGRSCFARPRWVYEGYATRIEGELTGSGRPGLGVSGDGPCGSLAVEGKLPSYGKPRRREAGSRDRLHTSARYLGWLDARGGADRLPELWRALEGGARRRVSLGLETRREPLYEKFLGEVKTRAQEQAGRLEKEGLVEGESGGASRAERRRAVVSPTGHGSRGATRVRERAPWPLGGRGRLDRGAAALDAAARESAIPRPIRGGCRAGAKFVRAAGARCRGRVDLGPVSVEPERGKGASSHARRGVADADPAPDGRHAVALRNRFGISSLVSVDFESGTVTPIPASAGSESEDGWLSGSHPRSPDGGEMPAGAPGRTLAPGANAGAGRRGDRADASRRGSRGTGLNPDGTRIWIAADGSGIWNLYEVPVSGGEAQARTRVTGGAFRRLRPTEIRLLSRLHGEGDRHPATGGRDDGPPSPSLPPRRGVPYCRGSASVVGSPRGEGSRRPTPRAPPLGERAWVRGETPTRLALHDHPPAPRLPPSPFRQLRAARCRRRRRRRTVSRWLAAGSVGDAAGPRGGASRRPRARRCWKSPATSSRPSRNRADRVSSPGPSSTRNARADFSDLPGSSLRVGSRRAEMGGGRTRVDAF